MGTYNLSRPGGTDQTPATEGGANTTASGRFVGGTPADAAGPYPPGKSSDYVAREAALRVAAGGKDLSLLPANEKSIAQQAFTSDVAGAVTVTP